MFSTSRAMITTLLACTLLSGCSSDLLAPGADDVNASIRTLGSTAMSNVTVSLRDSSLIIGDTAKMMVQAATSKNVRSVTYTYASSDTNVARVSQAGVVTARKNGNALLVVQSNVGKASVAISVVTPPPPPPPVDTTATPPVAPPADGTLPLFNAPMLPAATVDVRVPAVTGRTIRVAAGDAVALQNALNSAVGGDEVVLPNGSLFTGSFKLPVHSGSAPVIVRSETIGVPAGTRVTPTTGSSFATISTPTYEGAISVTGGASNWRLMGLKVELKTGTPDNYGIVLLGTGTETALDQYVSNIVLDRVIVAGGVAGSTSRCVSFNGNALAVVNSWLSDCHAKGRDAQGVGGWTGIGPYLIENNHIEGSGQAVMFGGADPRIANVTPSDITIRGNHMYKPMTWANGKWTVKATFELKNARRVLFEGNVLENHWADAQVGFAILLQGANQSGTAPWSKVQDVTVRNNLIRNSTSGINILSRLNSPVSDEPMRRVLVRNNLFTAVGNDPISGMKGVLVQLLSDHEDVTIVQNTFVGPQANNAVMFDGLPNKRLILFNNVFSATTYGIFGSGSGEGKLSLSTFAPGALVSGNVLTAHGDIVNMYPAPNFFPSAIATTDFVNAAGGDYTLRATVPFSASGGTIVGVSGTALLDAIRLTEAR